MFEPSAETLQRIRERTRLAMQDPKVMSCKHNFVNEVVKYENAIEKREPLKCWETVVPIVQRLTNNFVILICM